MASERKSEDSLVVLGLAVFAVVCCAAPILAVTLGLGTLFAFFTTPWVLAVTGLAVVGIFVWYSRRHTRSQRVSSQRTTSTRS